LNARIARMPLRVTLRASRRLGAVLVGLHAGAAATVLVADALPLEVRVALAAAAVLSLRGAWRAHASRAAPGAVVCIAHDDLGGWRVEYRDGRRCRVMPVATTLVHPALTLLVLRPLGAGRSARRIHVTIAPDALRAQDFRRLRGRLRGN
jgi:hypothetical protein